MNIYLSSSVRENFKNSVDLANELKTNMEICRFADTAILDGDLDAELNLYNQILRDFQGKLSIHGPFFDLNPTSKDPKISEITTYRYDQAYHVAKVLRATSIVFHTGYNGLVKSPIYHDKFIEDQIIFWRNYVKKFEDQGITVVLENTYEDTPEVISSIINNVNSQYLKACIDTGHVNINSSLNVEDWIDGFDKNLHHMHLHNNFNQADEHNSLLSGTLNFKEILKYMENKKLTPNLVLEIFSEIPALESLKFVREQYNLNQCKV